MTAYLRKLHIYVLADLKRRFTVTNEPFEQDEIQYCMTIPHTWSEDVVAKEAMRQAAVGAGLIRERDPVWRFRLVSEVDAAAMYCLRVVKDAEPGDRDWFMVCHVGEDAVDLVVYKVSVYSSTVTTPTAAAPALAAMAMPGHPQSQPQPQGVTTTTSTTRTKCLNQVSHRHGSSTGTDFLNANMDRLLLRKLQPYLHRLNNQAWTSLMTEFQNHVRPLFEGDGDDVVFLSLPQTKCGLERVEKDEAVGIEDGVLCFESEEVRREVFEPAVREVLEVVREQLDEEEE
ncbi:hypothetical protein BGW39_009114, partial [Mortierella sp. 14UC]